MGRAGIVVLGFDEVDTGLSPLLGEHICIVHVHIDGSAADPLRIRALSGEMDGQLVAMGERIPLDKRRQASPAGSMCGQRPPRRSARGFIRLRKGTRAYGIWVFSSEGAGRCLSERELVYGKCRRMPSGSCLEH
jgi:hypothetical protein